MGTPNDAILHYINHHIYGEIQSIMSIASVDIGQRWLKYPEFSLIEPLNIFDI